MITFQNYCYALVFCQGIFVDFYHAVGTEVSALGIFGGIHFVFRGNCCLFLGQFKAQRQKEKKEKKKRPATHADTAANPGTGSEYCTTFKVKDHFGLCALFLLACFFFHFFSLCIRVLMPCTSTNHTSVAFHFGALTKSRWLHVALVNPFHEGLREDTVHWT